MMSCQSGTNKILHNFKTLTNLSNKQFLCKLVYHQGGSASSCPVVLDAPRFTVTLTQMRVSVNVLLPGGATDTDFLPPGPDKKGADGGLLRPEIMRAPAAWLCSDQANKVTGGRYIARLWDDTLPSNEAAAAAQDSYFGNPAARSATKINA